MQGEDPHRGGGGDGAGLGGGARPQGPRAAVQSARPAARYRWGELQTPLLYPGLAAGPDAPWEDPQFPADETALFYSERPAEELADYSWARPRQLVERPHLFVDGTSRRDVIQVLSVVEVQCSVAGPVQGVLGDCWLLSTCAALAKKENLIQRVIDPDQVLNTRLLCTAGGCRTCSGRPTPDWCE